MLHFNELHGQIVAIHIEGLSCPDCGQEDVAYIGMAFVDDANYMLGVLGLEDDEGEDGVIGFGLEAFEMDCIKQLPRCHRLAQDYGVDFLITIPATTEITSLAHDDDDRVDDDEDWELIDVH